MREDVREKSGLYLCIYFSDIILIISSDGNEKCDWEVWQVNTLSKSEDRIWEIYKSQTSFKITGDDIEPLDLKFHLFCGELAYTTNFGWLNFEFELGIPSTAFYFVEDQSKCIFLVYLQ